MGIVYVITCKITGEQYVGATTRSLSWRWSTHKSAIRRNKSDIRLLAEAVRTHGEENFVPKILVEVSNEDLNEVERKTIRLVNPALNFRESPQRDERYPQPWRRRVRRQRGVDEANLDAPAYDPTIRRRRTYTINGEQLTTQEIKARYGQTVLNRVYADDPHPLRVKHTHYKKR